MTAKQRRLAKRAAARAATATAGAPTTADDVRHLQPLKKLLRLTLMNNPLDATREYRLHMIAHLPTLKMFDNVVITQSERHKVEGFNRRFAKRGSPQH